MSVAFPAKHDRHGAETTASGALANGADSHATGRRDRTRRIQYDRILVPVTASLASERAVTTAAMLAAERKGVVTLVHVIEVPKELPLDALFPDEEQDSRAILSRASATLDCYGIRTVRRSVHATTAAAAILDAAEEVRAEIIVVGTERRTRRQRTAVGRNVEYVLKRAPCRVMIVAV
jgi:basic amino acid/polyamine antiporter, APA family